MLGDIKEDLIQSALRELRPYILMEEDTSADLEGQVHGLEIASRISWEEIPAARVELQREVYAMLSEEEADTEAVSYLQGAILQLGFLQDRLSELASVLILHKGETDG
jgi:hypothetical protein